VNSGNGGKAYGYAEFVKKLITYEFFDIMLDMQ